MDWLNGSFLALTIISVLIWTAYQEATLKTWSFVIVLIVLYLDFRGTLPSFGGMILWAILFTGLLYINQAKVRKKYLTGPILKWFKSALPPMSKTESEAIAAGQVWWEGELFRGRPDWNQLLAVPKPGLSPEETAFIENEVEHLCSMLDEWEITQHLLDLPPSVWRYLKENRFFGIVIPKAYGGLGFSALANSTIVQKIATRGLTTAITTMVPNSLGPAELLLAYGTEAQKDYYLPRLADGREIPCFALTGPEAGSDASNIPDRGIVCKGNFQGQEVMGLKLNWDKRYITLAPVATVLGIAVKLYDPDSLLGNKKALGITVLLLPVETPGIEIGLRHFPLNQPFMNGPTRGKDVFVPLDCIIGGESQIGKGWRMLVESLSAGRGISLPALSTATGKLCYRTSGAYASIRKQFNISIAHFEGVEAALSKIAGCTYLLEATRLLTLTAIDQNLHPSIASAITKYHLTELSRIAMSEAMDIHAGKAIMLGPKNYLGRAYESIPISITVEGANILTRNLMIFGQGAIRCHPFIQAEMKAANLSDPTKALDEFDDILCKHIRYTLSNFARVFVHAITRGLFCKIPAFAKTSTFAKATVDKPADKPAPSIEVMAGLPAEALVKAGPKKHLKNSYRQLTRMSAALALASDLAMLCLGGKLKRKERLSARLGDVLSYLYMASAVLKYDQDFGDQTTDPYYVEWCIKTLLFKTQEALIDFCNNFPIRTLGFLLKFWIFPLGRVYHLPSDKLEHHLAKMMLSPNTFRERLTQHCYLGKDGPIQALESTFALWIETQPVLHKLDKAVKEGLLEKQVGEEMLQLAVAQQILTREERNLVSRYEKARLEVISVDEFSNEQLCT